MFCPHCGKENPENSKFCNACAAQLPVFNSIDHPKYRYSPDSTSILIGGIIIASMYFMPVIPFSGSNSITLAKYMDLCSNLFSQCSGSTLSWWWYAGWLAAIFFIIIGLFHRTKV